MNRHTQSLQVQVHEQLYDFVKASKLNLMENIVIIADEKFWSKTSIRLFIFSNGTTPKSSLYL